MASNRLNSNDFILTISDNEELLSAEERELAEEDIYSADGGPPRSRRPNLKRPAAAQDAEGEPVSKKKRRQEQRENGSSTIPGTLKSPEVSDGDDNVASVVEDDGAMNSDFEFQLGEADPGAIEEFDAWETDKAVRKFEKYGNKKGVDIEELVARRRRTKEEASQQRNEGMTEDSNDESKASDEPLQSDDKREKAGKSSEENFEGFEPDLEDDELLAPDTFGMGASETDEDDEAKNDTDESEDYQASASDDGSVASPVAHPDDEMSLSSGSDAESEENPEEKRKQAAFFAPEPKKSTKKSKNSASENAFQSMSLSRPILRGIASLGFSNPTPIQAKTIPVALMGKDVVGGAVTGSGKTAAFMIPILERLLYRPKKIPTSRVLVLAPTRELAVQCFNVAKRLAGFTDIAFCQLVGGFSLREQENILRTRPDVIIATPGRFIDHMRNSASFTVETLEILVLDEADRMLEDGFADELNEILSTIPKSRQTMLFSATMTSSVDKLIRVGLNRPARLIVDAQRQTVGTLVQEFVRLRPGRENKRAAYLLHLCSTVYTTRVIVFFRQKKTTHRMRVLFALAGLSAAELHGSMTQDQRLTAVERFRAGMATHLLATDVASRGLDIRGVETVINYEAPQSLDIYLHRVGRTARAGKVGRACTLAAEPDRKIVKAAVRAARAQEGAKIVSRVVEANAVDECAARLETFEADANTILAEEKEEKQIGKAEMQLRRGENILEHEAEIKARPKRTWFATEHEKKRAKRAGLDELNATGASGKAAENIGEDNSMKKKKQKQPKLSGKDKKRLEDKRERKEGTGTWKKGKADRAPQRNPKRATNGAKKQNGVKGGRPRR